MQSRLLFKACLALLLALVLLSQPHRLLADWPQFRGPSADGHASAAGLPLEWSETNNIQWKTAIPQRGWSTPVTMAGQIWITTATPEGKDFFVLCVDEASGKILFNERLFQCENPEPLGNNLNSYATPSVALEPGRVYVHFGSYGTACLDAQRRKVLWQRQDLPCRHFRGPASSPVVFQDLLILTFDGADQQYVVALEKKTGRTVWKTNRSAVWNDENIPGLAKEGDLRKAHSTPLVVEVSGQPQLISAGAKAAYGYDPRTGKEIWKVHHEAYSASAMPVFGHGLAFISTGYGGKTELLAVRPDGTGDVTDTHIAWRTDAMVAKMPSPVLVGNQLYMVSDDGMVTCLEATSGKQIWRSRIPGNYAASPVYADGRLYFFNQQGKTTVLKPGDSFEVLATNTLDNGFMASPPGSGNAFILRTKTHLYRVQAPAK